MSACENRIASLVDAASDALAPAERAALDAHLASCAGCRQELAELMETEALLRETSSAPDDFHLTGFVHRVADRAEAFRDQSPRGLWWSITRGMRLAMSFSATALVASLALFFSAGRTAPTSVAPSTSQASTVQMADSDAWLQDVPEALNRAHEEGLNTLIEEPAAQAASFDLGFDNLSDDELQALSDSLDQQTLGTSALN